MRDSSPAARAIVALELIQNTPGISGERLGDRLGVSDRAARRYVGILREAGIPIESTPGRYGGYRLGRGFRIPPLMFSPAEALGLVMAALEGRDPAASVDDPVESALGKIIRVLPTSLAGAAEAIRQVSALRTASEPTKPRPDIAAALAQSCAAHRRVRLTYRLGDGTDRVMDVDPWAVSIRHGRWYLLGWSHTKNAQRVLRVDRVERVEMLAETFAPPPDLDPVQAIAEHLAEGWRYEVDIVVDAPAADVAAWIPRNRGRLEAIDADHTRLLASTDEPSWYCQQLLAVDAPFHIVSPPELRATARTISERLLHAADG